MRNRVSTAAEFHYKKYSRLLLVVLSARQPLVILSWRRVRLTGSFRDFANGRTTVRSQLPVVSTSGLTGIFQTEFGSPKYRYNPPLPEIIL
jgi:hypothetical protein